MEGFWIDFGAEMEAIFEFLRMNNLVKTEKALREEIMEVKAYSLVPELPKLRPVRLQQQRDDDDDVENSTAKSVESLMFYTSRNCFDDDFFCIESPSPPPPGGKVVFGKSWPQTPQSKEKSGDLSDKLSGFLTADGDSLSLNNESVMEFSRFNWDHSAHENCETECGCHPQSNEDNSWFLINEIASVSVLKHENPGILMTITNNQLEDDSLKVSEMSHLQNGNLQIECADKINLNTKYCNFQVSNFSNLKNCDNSSNDEMQLEADKDFCSTSDEDHSIQSMDYDDKANLEIKDDDCDRSALPKSGSSNNSSDNEARKKLDEEKSDSFQDDHSLSDDLPDHLAQSPKCYIKREENSEVHLENGKLYAQCSISQSPYKSLQQSGSYSSRIDESSLNDGATSTSSVKDKEVLSVSLIENLEFSSQHNKYNQCLEEDDGQNTEVTTGSLGNAAIVAAIEDEDIEDFHYQLQKSISEEDEFEEFYLKIIHRKNRTGFEEEKDLNVEKNSVIAGRYHVVEYLGSAAFSKAIQAHDLHLGVDVCMKIIKNNKDFFDQSLDEIKLLKYVNRNDPADTHHLLRLYDYFYHREHLFIVCELLRANLYEFQTFNKESGGDEYFTMPRLQSIARQILEALDFLHDIGLIHCDLKPENVLIKSYSRCEIKVIDLGSSCFQTDNLCSYVQSRAYRAPEVILGLPYDQKIDIWSLGCILAELCSGQVLFQNDSVATLLARVIGIIGPIDPELIANGQEAHKYFTNQNILYEQVEDSDQLEYIIPKESSLSEELSMGDSIFVDFVGYLLQVNPLHRPSAKEALDHPWFSCCYEE